MASTHAGSPGAWWLAVGAVAALCVGCEEKRTTTQTPNGAVTTTTISPSPQASEAMRQINEKMAHAASAIESSTAASQALTKTGDAIEDGVITTKIKAALLADPDVKSLHIDVDTRNGQVTLSGTADKAASIERAVRIARDTQGVKAVDNQLVVKTSA
jgi:hyperosmotically inducible periplasmic protein